MRHALDRHINSSISSLAILKVVLMIWLVVGGLGEQKHRKMGSTPQGPTLEIRLPSNHTSDSSLREPSFANRQQICCCASTARQSEHRHASANKSTAGR